VQVLRAGDRAFTAKAIAAQTGMAEEAFGGLNWRLRHAAYRGGLPALREAGWLGQRGTAAVHGDGAGPSGTEECASQDRRVPVPADLSVGALRGQPGPSCAVKLAKFRLSEWSSGMPTMREAGWG
jgi:hypothetical protein